MLAARRMMLSGPVSAWLDCAGTQNYIGGSGWSMSSTTVAYRISGTWTTVSIPVDTLARLGLADAYRVTAVVGANPTGSGNYYDWMAGWGSVLGRAAYPGSPGTPTSGQHGVFLETDNSTSTLYLFHNNAIAMSQGATGTLPVAGDTIEVTSDFAATTATAKKNGTTIATINFAGQTWYTADGANV